MLIISPDSAQWTQIPDRRSEAWRRIDYDWLTTTDELALQLDNVTNNTSLALAIELINDGRVLLFPADAQLGNWTSWADIEFSVTEDNTKHIITTDHLLQHTVCYKVGHHASHNATLKPHGLEAMQREDLVALIPVDRQVAMKKKPPWQMPADALYTRLVEKTHGRVLRSDIGFAADKPVGLTQEEWDDVLADKNIIINDLYIEYHLH